MDKYILDEDGQPQLMEDVLEWGRWFEDADDKRRVASDHLPGDIHVSTVFLGIDHCFTWHEHVPILWELMIFAPEGHLDEKHPYDGWQERFTSREEALARHQEIVRCLREGIPLE